MCNKRYRLLPRVTIENDLERNDICVRAIKVIINSILNNSAFR